MYKLKIARSLIGLTKFDKVQLNNSVFPELSTLKSENLKFLYLLLISLGSVVVNHPRPESELSIHPFLSLVLVVERPDDLETTVFRNMQ